ncbi:MAG: tRNA (guanosine(37)-N1)-methyltransferase TrmD, partial [Halobacteriovoraceae bacterium]|nr:tRNA (guanosine(37)-N1)-methyltransferase TrmD [Halobacteriovoraceae bacterium]
MRVKKIWILTLFPEYFHAFQSCGVIGKALAGERSEELDLELKLINIRDFSDNNYKSVDDYPFGGGAGMVLRADVLQRALQSILEVGNYQREDLHVVFPSPRGKVWNNVWAREFADEYIGLHSCEKDLVFICGRYEGIDERFVEKYVDTHISLGDFILSGGELATMCILDSTLRFVEGILGNRSSHQEESFQDGLLEHPQYTKPRVFEDREVPSVLLSGHHKKMEEFKKTERLRLTQKYRPD